MRHPQGHSPLKFRVVGLLQSASDLVHSFSLFFYDASLFITHPYSSMKAMHFYLQPLVDNVPMVLIVRTA